MRTVHIADDVYAALQRAAVPFEDDINDVLRRRLRRSGEIATPISRRHFDDYPHRNGGAVSESTSNGNGVGHTARFTELDPDEAGTVIVHRREANGVAIPQSTYRAAVLGALRSADESRSVSDLLRHVQRQLGDRMTAADLEVVASGAPRWQNQVGNALTQLQHEGRIEAVRDGWYRYRNDGRSQH
jgi:hypothetical protein